MKRFGKLVIFFLIISIGVVVGSDYLISKSKSESGGRQEKTGKPLKFAVMADIHSDLENFRKALEKVKDFGDVGGFIIITGDLTTLGRKNELLEAKKILDESGLKYFVIPGNHDIWWGRKYKQDVWGEVFKESYQSFKEGEIKFILINNGDGENGLGGLEGAAVQRRWLEEETIECMKVYCLVFMHMPLNHPSSLHVMGEGNPPVASEAAELVKLFIKNQVKDVFAGHLHYSSSYELDGLKTTIVGAITSERNFQSPKFLEVEISKGKLLKKEIFIFD